MYFDSHCHLNFPQLQENFAQVLQDMQDAKVSNALVIGTTLEHFDEVLQLAVQHSHLWCSVGVHPDERGVLEPTLETLMQLAEHRKVVAIGETGLDYYRCQDNEDMVWQRERFRCHIRAAKALGLPLIIHTRAAARDTLSLLVEELANPSSPPVNGVFHCFTEEGWVAQEALKLGFYISFSGIITFKNASAIREVVKNVPLDRLLIETDSPYLAPVPHRGKMNTPAWVPLVAQEVAQIHGISPEEVADITFQNTCTLFRKMELPPLGL
ncbi:MAG: TatD family hydrolase [Gammaproteobacteria bacterium]|nr:TatD family hydrolase [Gammaproteobacteria bacterium]